MAAIQMHRRTLAGSAPDYSVSEHYSPQHYLETNGNTGIQLPAIAGAKALAFWIHSTNNQQYGSFLVDFREFGTGYWWALNAPAGLIDATIDGSRTSSYVGVFSPGWHKVYLEFDSLDQGFYLLCRYSENEFFFPSTIADITFYDRTFTEEEKTNPTSPLPTTNVIGKYRGDVTPGGQLLELSGRQPNARIIGESPVSVSTAAASSDSKWTSTNSRAITDEHIVFPGLGNHLPTGSATVEFWAATSQALATVVFGNQSSGIAGSGGNNRLMGHLPWPDGNIYWDCGSIGTGDRNTAGRVFTPLPDSCYNTWHHYAFVSNLEANWMEVFIDGVLQLQATNHDCYKRTDEDFYIGWWTYNNINFNGSIGEFRIWNYARSPAQIQAEMNSLIDSARPGLIACWRLDDRATAIVDRSGNNHHGFIS